jgi:hypothetical protein
MQRCLVLTALGLSLACSSEGTDAGTTSGGAGSGGATGTTTTAGSAGTGGAGTGGGSGGGSDAGTGGSGGTESMDAGVDGRADGGASSCPPGKYIICEDFEGTAAGSVPSGWTKHGGAAVVTDEAARGTHSLKIDAAINGERRIYADATGLGSGHWGRIFYKVQAPPVLSCDTNPVLHSTIVAFQGIGPVHGAEEVRVVDTVENQQGKHQFLYNVQPNGAEFATGSPYNWQFDGAWHCAEWHIDNPTQSYHFYIDGAEVTSIALDNGAGNYARTDIPPSFSQVRVGWNNYQKACAPGSVAWIDEVALDAQRIGCGN